MFACICRRVTEAEVFRAGLEGALVPDALITVLGLDDDMCCGQCVRRIDEFVALARRGGALEPAVQEALRGDSGAAVAGMSV